MSLIASTSACPPICAAPPVTTIAGGLSGAAVHRVDANRRTFVLKISKSDESIDTWRARLEILRLAADGGVAPRVIHADEARRAVLSVFVAGKPFVAAYGNPRTRDAAVSELGRTLRCVHDLPVPPTPTREIRGTSSRQHGPGFPRPRGFQRSSATRFDACSTRHLHAADATRC